MSNNERVNWNEVNFRKESSMAWLNAMNNAAVLVAAWIPLLGKLDEEQVLKMLESLRNKIYKLNISKIDHDAAQNISEKYFEP